MFLVLCPSSLERRRPEPCVQFFSALRACVVGSWSLSSQSCPISQGWAVQKSMELLSCVQGWQVIVEGGREDGVGEWGIHWKKGIGSIEGI